MDTKTISLDERILALLEDEGDFLNTSQIAKDLGVATHTAHGACDRLHLHGKIAKAPVWASSSQTKASWVLWAITTDSFRNTDPE